MKITIAIIAAVAAFFAAIKLGWEWRKQCEAADLQKAYSDGYVAGATHAQFEPKARARQPRQP